MIQGVIFDMDGLMFDTERIWDTCWAPALAKFGLSYKEGLSQASRGTTRSGTCDVLRRFYGDGCPAAGIVEELYRLAYEAFTKPVPKMAGLDELLAWQGRHLRRASGPLEACTGHLSSGRRKAGHCPCRDTGAGGQLQRCPGRRSRGLRHCDGARPLARHR